jgi:hypothetical protein
VAVALRVLVAVTVVLTKAAAVAVWVQRHLAGLEALAY